MFADAWGVFTEYGIRNTQYAIRNTQQSKDYTLSPLMASTATAHPRIRAKLDSFTKVVDNGDGQ